MTDYTLDDALAAVGPGWHPLVRRAYRMAAAAGALVLHVTEDCAALRVYTDAAPRTLLSVQMLRLERESLSICETNGAPGERRANERGWLSTRCETHK